MGGMWYYTHAVGVACGFNDLEMTPHFGAGRGGKRVVERVAAGGREARPRRPSCIVTRDGGC